MNPEEVPAPIIVYDGEGRVIEANPAACELLGVDPNDLLGSNAADAGWLVVEGSEAPITVHPVVAALKSRQAVRAVLARARRPDGTDVWLQVDALPDASNGTSISRVTATLTDVTYLLTRSRATSRSAGDHIVDQVTDRLAQARMEPDAILSTVTRALSKLRPGIWVASLMGKDPSNMQIVASDSNDDDGYAESYASGYVQSMRGSGLQNTAPISSRVIESGQPLLLPEISMEQLMGYLNDEVRAYLADHPWLSPATHLGIVVVPMRARGATIGTLGLFERRGSNPLTEKDTVWVQAIADRTGLAVENAQLYEDAAGDLFRTGQASQRQSSAGLPQHFLGEILAFTRRVGPARINDIDADAVAGQLQRGGPRHLVECGFSHVVGHARRDGLDGVHRADDDDVAALALLDHLVGGRP